MTSRARSDTARRREARQRASTLRGTLASLGAWPYKVRVSAVVVEHASEQTSGLIIVLRGLAWGEADGRTHLGLGEIRRTVQGRGQRRRCSLWQVSSRHDTMAGLLLCFCHAPRPIATLWLTRRAITSIFDHPIRDHLPYGTSGEQGHSKTSLWLHPPEGPGSCCVLTSCSARDSFGLTPLPSLSSFFLPSTGSRPEVRQLRRPRTRAGPLRRQALGPLAPHRE